MSFFAHHASLDVCVHFFSFRHFLFEICRYDESCIVLVGFGDVRVMAVAQFPEAVVAVYEIVYRCDAVVSFRVYLLTVQAQRNEVSFLVHRFYAVRDTSSEGSAYLSEERCQLFAAERKEAYLVFKRGDVVDVSECHPSFRQCRAYASHVV